MANVEDLDDFEHVNVLKIRVGRKNDMLDEDECLKVSRRTATRWRSHPVKVVNSSQ